MLEWLQSTSYQVVLSKCIWKILRNAWEKNVALLSNLKETVTGDFICLGSKVTVYSDCSHLLLGRKPMTNLDNVLRSRDITLLTKVHIIKATVFPVVMYNVRVGPKRRLSTEDWGFWTVVLEKTLESPLDCKEIKPVNPKGNQPWIVFGRADAEALIFWPPNAKSQLLGEDCDAVKEWRQKEMGTTEDEMVGCYHWHSGPSLVT